MTKKKTSKVSKSKPLQEGHRIEMVALSTLERWPRNPKLHAEKALNDSIEKFGFVQPILVDEGTGRIVAGHGRLEALQKLKESGAPVPARIQETDGEWMVPVIRGVEFADEQEAEAYLLADNRMVELGGWDEEQLWGMLKGFEPDLAQLVGWSDKDLRTLQSHVEADQERAKTPEEQLGVFLANGIRQMVFHLDEDQYRKVLTVFENVMEKRKLLTTTEVLLYLVDHAA